MYIVILKGENMEKRVEKKRKKHMPRHITFENVILL